MVPEESIVLRLEDITRSFPGVKALDSVSFDIRRGEVHALVGENGAGKSTLMHILGGVYRPDRGKILLEGEEVSFRSAHEAQVRGIRVVYQELSIVPNLSAAENIFANIQPVNALGLVNRRELNRRAAEMIRLFGEEIDPDIPAGDLPIGKRQVLEILKALTRDPRIVLLDEPTSSLSGVETDMLFRNIRRLREQGISFIFISHHLPEIFRIADRVTVLRDGVCQGTYPTAEITEDFLISRMVGRNVGDIFKSRERYAGPSAPVLEVEGLSRRGEFEDISFTVHAGEILGFAGLVGAGRTEVGRALFGLEPPERGTVRLDGAVVRIRSAGEAIRHGIGYLTEDRKVQGLCLSLTIRENLIGPSLGRFTSRFGFPNAGASRENRVAPPSEGPAMIPGLPNAGASREIRVGPSPGRFAILPGLLDDGAIRRYAREMVTRFNIATPSIEQTVYHLSGGNQQKVLLGMWMGIDPRVLIVDEPTRGVDVGAKEEIYAHIRELAARGAAVMLISSDLKEILGLSDRICVMREGRIRTTSRADEATEESIISHALGAGEASA